VVESRQLPGDEAALELLSERGRIVAAQSPYHPTERTSGFLLGVLKVAAADRGALVAVAAQLADQCRHGPPPASEVAAGLEPETTTPTQAAAMADDVVALVLHGLVEGGTAVSGTELRGLSWARPLSARRAEEAARQMLATDEDRILLDAAVKASDGFFTTFFVSPYSKYIARWCARRGVTPNQVTTFSMVLGALAALAFAAGTRTGLVAGAVALQLAFTFDCVDGQLARYTRQFSTLGAWLDSVFDRTKEYAVYAGLAVGAVRSDGDGGIWLLAAAALTLQVVRHAADFSFAEVRESTARRSASTTDEPGPHVDLEGHLHEGDAATPPRPARTSRLSGLGRAAVVASGYSEEQAWMKWSKRVLVFPIGERFALISVTAALLGPRATFVALLTWGGVAASYGLAGRTLRSVL
jgi:phosphatidylglycerophosphate synthase